MHQKTLVLIAAGSLFLSAPVSAAQTSSVYVDLSAGNCATIKVDEQSGSSLQKCPGVAGYSLLVEDQDGRQSATVVAPGGRQHPLEYSRVITSAFSSLGLKAEWRVEKAGAKLVPVALIIRVIANENPESPDRKTAYLAVAKITSGKICVTDKVKNGAQANEEARRAADQSAGKPCL